MASSLNADNGVVSGSAGLKSTADTSGVLALQSNGTTALSIGTNLNVTLTNPLPVASGGTGATSLSGITAGTATNLAGGSNGTIPYQSASGTTQMLAAGTSGQVLTSGGVGAPTWTTPASAGSYSFTASGSIASAGLPVALNSDGTVSTVTSISSSAAVTVADAAASAGGGKNMLYSSTSNVYVIVYHDNIGNSIKAIAGTLSGTTYTWGTKVTVKSSAAYYNVSAWDSANNKFVVVTTDNSNNLEAFVLSVSGTTISVGASVVIVGDGSGTTQTSLAYEATSGKLVLAYRNSVTGGCLARIGTVSGTSTSWTGTTNLFSSVNSRDPYVYCSNGSAIFNGANNSTNICHLQAGTISGTTLSVGTYSAVSGFAVRYGTTTYQPLYDLYYWTGSQESNGFISYQAFTVSGSTLSVSGSATITSVPINIGSPFASTYDATAKKIVVGYQNINQYPTMVSFMAPASISTPLVISTAQADTASIEPGGLAYSSGAGKVAAAITGTSYGLTGAIITTPYSTNVNTIGISTAAASNGASTTCTILGGINTGVSGLTIGTTYYASATGTLTTTTPNNFKLGRALSATSLLMTNGTFP